MTMPANMDIDSDVVLGQCDFAHALSARRAEAPAFSFAAAFMKLPRVDRLRSENATQQFNRHAPAQFSQTQRRPGVQTSFSGTLHRGQKSSEPLPTSIFARLQNSLSDSQRKSRAARSVVGPYHSCTMNR